MLWQSPPQPQLPSLRHACLVVVGRHLRTLSRLLLGSPPPHLLLLRFFGGRLGVLRCCCWAGGWPGGLDSCNFYGRGRSLFFLSDSKKKRKQLNRTRTHTFLCGWVVQWASSNFDGHMGIVYSECTFRRAAGDAVRGRTPRRTHRLVFAKHNASGGWWIECGSTHFDGSSGLCRACTPFVRRLGDAE